MKDLLLSEEASNNKKKLNNTIIDSIITGMDRCMLSVFIHSEFAVGWLYVLVTQQTML